MLVEFSSFNVCGFSLVVFSSKVSFGVVSVSAFSLSVSFEVGSVVDSGVFSFVSSFSSIEFDVASFLAIFEASVVISLLAGSSLGTSVVSSRFKFSSLVTPSEAVLLSTFSVAPSFSAAFASSLEAPNINVTPNKIEAVPTVNLRIEYLLFTFGKKSSFLDFFIKLKPPKVFISIQ